MRIATMIIGFLLGVVMTFQTVLVYMFGSVGAELGSSEAEAAATAGAVGIFVVLLWLIGIAFEYGLPKVSIVAFVLAGLLGFGVSGDYPDMGVWGTISLGLAVMSFFGNREKRRKDAEKQEQREALAAFRQMQQQS